MKFRTNKIKFVQSENNEIGIALLTKDNIHADIQELKNIIGKGKELSVEIKQYRHKRSLNSNAYMWLLLNEMAGKLNTTKDELYLQMLDRYGIFTHIVVKPHVVERVRSEWKTVIVLGEITVNGQTGIQLQCFFGSSTYDTKEMNRLINGVVQEAKELGINTMTPAEIDSMNNEWGK